MTEGTTVETREYNSVGQMTRILATQSGSATMDLRYDFTAGANNGRIWRMQNIVTGRTSRMRTIRLCGWPRRLRAWGRRRARRLGTMGLGI